MSLFRSSLRCWLLIAASIVASATPLHAAISVVGNVTPNPTTSTASTSLLIGDTANGDMTVNGGSDVVSLGARIGHTANTIGNVTLDGAGSTWQAQVVVGYSGTGTVMVKNGASLLHGGPNSYSSSIIGFNPNSQGTVTVDGSGSAWSSSDYIYVGNMGHGSLTISNGGVVETIRPLQIQDTRGQVTLNNGTLRAQTITGRLDRLLGVGNVFTTGWAFNEDLDFSQPADLLKSYQLNSAPGQNIAVSVDLSTANGWISAGATRRSQIVLRNGLTLTTTVAGLGGNFGTDATVRGAGSTWNSLQLYIGGTAASSLTVEQGGVATAIHALAGEFAGQSGLIAIDGPGSRLDSTLVTIGEGGRGTLALRNGGIVAATSDVRFDRLGGQAILDLEMGNAGFGRLNASGKVTIGDKAVLRATYAADAAPVVGQTYNVIQTVGGIVGSFSNTHVHSVGGDYDITWAIRQTAKDISLEVIYASLAGDFNGDGRVDGADFLAWQRGASPAALSPSHLASWRARFGSPTSTPSAGSLASVVPEPAAGALIILGLLVAAGNVRRR